MRKRALSREGCRLFSSGMLQHQGRQLFCSLFSSDYDDRLNSVLTSCRLSTKVLCTLTDQPSLQQHLDTAVVQTIKLIISEHGKKLTKRNMAKNYNFFLDIMNHALNTDDHQTACLMFMALTHPIIQELSLKMPKKNQTYLENSKNRHGCGFAGFKQHVQEFKWSRRMEYLPSLYAIHTWCQLCHKKGLDTSEIDNMMEIYKYIFRGELMPLYHTQNITIQDLIKI